MAKIMESREGEDEIRKGCGIENVKFPEIMIEIKCAFVLSKIKP